MVTTGAAWTVTLYRPALKKAGLEIETYEETPNWADRQFALLRAMAAAEQQLRAEMDDESANEFMLWARGRPAELVNTRRMPSLDYE